MFAANILRVNTWTTDAVFLGIVFIPMAQLIVMGPARLDDYRVASISVVLIGVWAATGAVRIVGQLEKKGPHNLSFPFWFACAGFAILGAIIVFQLSLKDSPRDLCCNISPSESNILAVAHELQQSEFPPGVLPIVANPDLGKISFVKQVINVDLGLLGDPVLARIQIRRPELVTEYLNRVAVPDVVETHQSWSCVYTEWIESKDFQSSYSLSGPEWVAQEYDEDPNCPLEGKYAIWIRQNATEEFSLSRSIAESSDPIQVIKAAVVQCSSNVKDSFECEWVRRAITRNSPNLRDQGSLETAALALGASPSFSLDKELILREPGWAERAFGEFLTLVDRNSN